MTGQTFTNMEIILNMKRKKKNKQLNDNIRLKNKQYTNFLRIF